MPCLYLSISVLILFVQALLPPAHSPEARQSPADLRLPASLAPPCHRLKLRTLFAQVCPWHWASNNKNLAARGPLSLSRHAPRESIRSLAARRPRPPRPSQLNNTSSHASSSHRATLFAPSLLRLGTSILSSVSASLNPSVQWPLTRFLLSLPSLSHPGHPLLFLFFAFLSFRSIFFLHSSLLPITTSSAPSLARSPLPSSRFTILSWVDPK